MNSNTVWLLNGDIYFDSYGAIEHISMAEDSIIFDLPPAGVSCIQNCYT